MGKMKPSASSSLRQYVGEFCDTFTSDGKILFHHAYRKSAASQQSSQVKASILQLLTAQKIGQVSLSLNCKHPATGCSSGPSKFPHFVKDVRKTFMLAGMPLF
jgi:hypothetical protein